MNDTYPIAYVQVIAMLNYYVKKEQLSNIPISVIRKMIIKADKNYTFEFDNENPYKSLNKKAKAILLHLYKEYFLDEEKGKKLLLYMKTLKNN